jgi:hypothetical protein
MERSFAPDVPRDGRFAAKRPKPQMICLTAGRDAATVQRRNTRR